MDQPADLNTTGSSSLRDLDNERNSISINISSIELDSLPKQIPDEPAFTKNIDSKTPVDSKTAENAKRNTPENTNRNNNTTIIYAVNDSSPSSNEALKNIPITRKLKRTISYYPKCVGNASMKTPGSESEIQTLTPKRGKVRINPKLTAIRVLLDQFELQPLLQHLHPRFNIRRALLEFFYNAFQFLAYPFIIYFEGMNGLHARQYTLYYGCPSILYSSLIWISWLAFFASNIIFFAFTISHKLRDHFWFPIACSNILTFVRFMIIAIKYGYFYDHIIHEYNDDIKPPPIQYILSLHLIPGWVAQSPLCMARELWIAEQILNIKMSNLRLTFRDTSAFNLNKIQNCSCSRYWTKLDWLVPFVYTFIDYTFFGIVSKMLASLYSLVVIVFIVASTIFVRMIENGRIISECDEQSFQCFTLMICIPIATAFGVWSALVWSLAMATDFTRRYYRNKFVTHLLDPKRDAFIHGMKKKYKAHLFGSVTRTSRKVLANLDLHTIDIYSQETLYSWMQLREIFNTCGGMFLSREQAQNGILVLSVLFILLLFFYCFLDENITIVIEDLLLVLFFVLCVFVPNCWTLSCAESLNKESLKQTKILCERIVDMQHYEYLAVLKKQEYWQQDLNCARQTAESIIHLLQQKSEAITFLGVRVDHSVVQFMATFVAIIFYVTGWLAYTEPGFIWGWN